MGVISGVISIVMEVELAHWLGEGLKVNVCRPILAVLMVAGFQLPVIPGIFDDINGRAEAVLNWQYGPIALKIGVIEFVMVITPVVFKELQLLPEVEIVYV